MKAALEQARKALAKGEVPVGAVLVKGADIIAQAHNGPKILHDPSGHAEILALRRGAKKLKNYRLLHTELYVTIEPCIMCIGAMLYARVARLVFGAFDPKAGAAGSVFDFTSHAKLNHSLEVETGIFAEECSQLIKNFFKRRRDSKPIVAS